MSRRARGAQANTERFSDQQTCRTVRRSERHCGVLGYSTLSLLAAEKPVDFRSCLMGMHCKGDTGFEDPVSTTENCQLSTSDSLSVHSCWKGHLPLVCKEPLLSQTFALQVLSHLSSSPRQPCRNARLRVGMPPPPALTCSEGVMLLFLPMFVLSAHICPCVHTQEIEGWKSTVYLAGCNCA